MKIEKEIQKKINKSLFLGSPPQNLVEENLNLCPSADMSWIQLVSLQFFDHKIFYSITFYFLKYTLSTTLMFCNVTF